MKIKNKKVINRISFCTLKAKRKKNLITVFAIMLTTIMFTVLFMIAGAMNKSFQEATMREVGAKTMAEVKYILPEDYERLSGDSVVENPSYRIIVGQAENEELLKVNTEINYAEEENAESMFCHLEAGTMPKERLEIATSTLVLDALGLPYKLGETVTLTFSVDEKKITENFILSGYWKGDIVAMAQQCLVSKIYYNEIAPTPEVSFYQSDGIHYAGYWMMDFDYSNSWDIEGKTVALLERNGYDSNVIDYGVNWAYTTSSVDTETLVFIIFALCLIFISGYLIIYNIFALNVAGDIQSYGLLKTIGMTEKQLKKLVHRQAVILSLAGIPCGLVFGALIGKGMFSVVVVNFVTNGVMEFSIHLALFAGAAVFSFFTVWMSSNKPCRLAAKVSPFEAVRYTDISYNGKRKEKKTRKVTTFSFGWANIRRNPKKVVVVVLSLSLSMILLNSVYTLVSGFDFDQYVSSFLVGDALLTDETVFRANAMIVDHSGITEDIQKELNNMEGIEGIHNVYFESTAIEMEDTIYENIIQFIDKNPEFSAPYYEEEIDLIKESRLLDCDIYGIDEWGTEQLEVYKGTFDWKKFKTGKYILINPCASEGEGSKNAFYNVGEKLELEFSDGTTDEYEVMAIADIPYSMTCRRFSFLNTQVILPETEYLEHTEDKGALFSILTVSEEKNVSIYEDLKNYTDNIHKNLDIVTKQTYVKEFEEFVNMFWMVGGALSFVLALIGILNFINSVVTEILARKKEFAMMEVVGMTGMQMKCMLVWEGSIYIILIAIVSFVIGGLFSSTILGNALKDMWFLRCHFTVMPIVICIPVLILAACIIPVAAYEMMAKESVVERLREKE